MKIDIVNSDKLFNPIYLKYGLNNNHRYQIYFGGSSSGKSYFLAQRIVIDVLKGRNYLVVRNVLNTVRRSILNEITKAINCFSLSKYFNINKTDLTITCTINKKQILFAGLDDTEKIKSITPVLGVITDVFIEEATEVSYEAVKQLDKRLRGHSNKIKRITFAFNPILKEHWLYKEYFSNWNNDKQYVEDADVSILKTTYKDNNFLTTDDIAALENETDKYYYEVYTLGKQTNCSIKTYLNGGNLLRQSRAKFYNLSLIYLLFSCIMVYIYYIQGGIKWKYGKVLKGSKDYMRFQIMAG